MTQQETELTIESTPIVDLRPDPFNPRKISAEETAALDRSVQKFGIVDPIIARRQDRTVIGGHQRLQAARLLLQRSSRPFGVRPAFSHPPQFHYVATIQDCKSLSA